jgi:hypothetical protein
MKINKVILNPVQGKRCIGTEFKGGIMNNYIHLVKIGIDPPRIIKVQDLGLNFISVQFFLEGRESLGRFK